jgi:GTP-binding protein
MRRARKVDSEVERFSLMRAEESIRSADVVVLVMDATTEPTRQDKRIAALINEHRRGCVLLVNKWDLQPETQRAFTPALFDLMPFMEFCPLVYASALTGYNVRKSIEAIDEVGASVHKRISTGALNRVILAAQARVAAPSAQGRRLKIYYSTQVSDHPIRVRIFVNDPRRVQPAYRKFLEKTIRAEFALAGSPVVLEFAARRRPEQKRGKMSAEHAAAEDLAD